MKTKLTLGGGLTGLVVAGGIAGMVSAQTLADATGLSEEQAIAIALAEIPGEMTEVELEQEDGQEVYEVEILTLDGSEMEIEVAADTGDILSVEAEAEDDHDDDHDDD